MQLSFKVHKISVSLAFSLASVLWYCLCILKVVIPDCIAFAASEDDLKLLLGQPDGYVSCNSYCNNTSTDKVGVELCSVVI